MWTHLIYCFSVKEMKNEKDTGARGPQQVWKTYIFDFEIYKKDNILTVH